MHLDIKRIPSGTKKRIKALLSNERKLITLILQNAISKQKIRKIDPVKAAEVLIHFTEGIRFSEARKAVLGGKKRGANEILEEIRLAISYFINGMK